MSNQPPAYNAQTVSVNGNSAYSQPVFLIPNQPQYQSTTSSSTNVQYQQQTVPTQLAAKPAVREAKQEVKLDDDKLKKLLSKHEISKFYLEKIKQLKGFEVVFICDDSGSMNNVLKGTSQTRWNELEKIVGTAAEVATLLDPDGVDLYFLNRAVFKNVKSSDGLRGPFKDDPEGYTPIARVLRQILKDKKDVTKEKNLLIMIATDGQPSDDNGTDDRESVEYILKYERDEKTFVSFLACTDDDSTMKYLDAWDKSMKRLDVVDDYLSEQAQVYEQQKKKGEACKFTYGDYIVKALVGSFDETMDKADE